jgi:hypothetical protein
MLGNGMLLTLISLFERLQFSSFLNLVFILPSSPAGQATHSLTRAPKLLLPPSFYFE